MVSMLVAKTKTISRGPHFSRGLQSRHRLSLGQYGRSYSYADRGTLNEA